MKSTDGQKDPVALFWIVIGMFIMLATMILMERVISR
jgi:hypothetical protein